MALVRAVTSMREERGLTNQQLIDGAEMSASYYYARLRGDAPFDTNDIERLAAALGTHPHEISRVAAALEAAGEAIEPHVSVDPRELGRRLKLIAASPRLDGSAFEADELIDQLAARGVMLERSEWSALRRGNGPTDVRSRLLEGVADYAGLPPAYLLDLTDHEAQESAEAQLDFRSALVDSGADSISARTVGDVSPAALRAIAQSLRSIPSR